MNEHFIAIFNCTPASLMQYGVYMELRSSIKKKIILLSKQKKENYSSKCLVFTSGHENLRFAKNYKIYFPVVF